MNRGIGLATHQLHQAAPGMFILPEYIYWISMTYICHLCERYDPCGPYMWSGLSRFTCWVLEYDWIIWVIVGVICHAKWMDNPTTTQSLPPDPVGVPGYKDIWIVFGKEIWAVWYHFTQKNSFGCSINELSLKAASGFIIAIISLSALLCIGKTRLRCQEFQFWSSKNGKKPPWHPVHQASVLHRSWRLVDWNLKSQIIAYESKQVGHCPANIKIFIGRFYILCSY